MLKNAASVLAPHIAGHFNNKAADYVARKVGQFFGNDEIAYAAGEMTAYAGDYLSSKAIKKTGLHLAEGALEATFKIGGKEIPVLGAVVAASFTVNNAYGYYVDGLPLKAFSELVAGTADTIGSVWGFGAGDAAREVTRGVMGLFMDEENLADKSSLRVLAETAMDLGGIGSKPQSPRSMPRINAPGGRA
jgi:hypothetical protein